MNIVGFGDSFISGHVDSNRSGYLDDVGDIVNAESVTWNGYPGSGSWDAFFQFKNYEKLVEGDVVIFSWSDPARLYNRRVRNLCLHGSSLPIDKDNPDAKVWHAARQYYAELYDYEKTEYEAAAFYYWVDNWLASFTKIKFIHLWGFAKNTPGIRNYWDMYLEENTDKLEYHHHFKNGAEIRPALMSFSRREGWSALNDLKGETRLNHLTPKYHSLLASMIADAIENYEPGKIFTEKKS